MDKPKLSVTVTSTNDSTITKTFSKVNGLKSLTINGVTNDLPYYGIISRTGTVEIIDNEGWFKEQSDANILPDIVIEIQLDGIMIYQFISDSDISYSKLDKTVTINLIDSIEGLQDKVLGSDIQYTNTYAYNIFIDMCSILGIEATMNDDTTKYLQDIRIYRMLIPKDSVWNIIQQFAYATRCLFYKEGRTYILRRVEE